MNTHTHTHTHTHTDFPGSAVGKIHLPMQETQKTWVQSLDWEDPLEKEMEMHSRILAWKIPSIEEPGGL